jgi:hypothetical protein
VNKVLSRIGTVVIGLAMLGGGALVLWNVFGQGPYGDSCQFSLGCRSFYCLSHELRGNAQVSSKGRCTKSCDADAECGAGAVCVVLSEASRDDLPPFGKPDKACMLVLESPADIRQ